MRLDIRVLAPHHLSLPDGGAVTIEAFVPDFGGPSGTAVVFFGDAPRARLAALANVYVSRVSDTYGSFNAELFRETLDDWGWHSVVASPPQWYTGRHWGG